MHKLALVDKTYTDNLATVPPSKVYLTMLCFLSRVHTTGDDVGKGNSRDQRYRGSGLALCVTSYTAFVVHNLAIIPGAIILAAVLVKLVFSPLPTSRPEAVIE